MKQKEVNKTKQNKRRHIGSFPGLILLVLSCLLPSGITHAQDIAIKTNLLYNATATFNLGGEVKLSDQYTLDLSVGYNPWTFNDNRKWKHVLVQPEARYWLKESFNGHFLGIHGQYINYNVGNTGPFHTLENNRYEGWGLGAGLSYGYMFRLADHWRMEASLGVGYTYLEYDKYDCRKCGDKQKSSSSHYVGPTRLNLSVIYIIK